MIVCFEESKVVLGGFACDLSVVGDWEKGIRS